MGASFRFWWGGGGHRRRQAHEQCRQCRRPAPSARRRRAYAPRAGGMGASLRFWWGGGGCRRRQAHEQCRQCRRPAPSARDRRAHAPRAGGMGASLRFWWGGRGRRRRQAHEQGPAACGAWGDAALPRWGKGRCGDAGATLFAPVGQRRCCVARLVLAGSRRNAVYEAICPSGRAGRRAGRRGKTALRIRAHPSRAGRRARSTGGRGRWALRAAKTARSSRGRLVFATIPRGDRRALPAPAQGTSPLGIPFWGTGPHLPRLPVPHPPVPPNAAGGKSLLVDLPPSVPSPPHQKRKEASMPPARGAWMRRLRAEGAGRRHCRP